MEVKIVSEKYNAVIKRKEINVEILYIDVPPKTNEIITTIAGATKTDTKNVALTKVRNIFGNRKLLVNANVYDNPEDMKKYELKYRLVRAGLMEKEKKKAEPATAKKK